MRVDAFLVECKPLPTLATEEEVIARLTVRIQMDFVGKVWWENLRRTERVLGPENAWCAHRVVDGFGECGGFIDKDF
jgi:hypothetical protein